MTYIDDDGSTISYDAWGNITGVTDTYGAVVPVGGDVLTQSRIDGAISQVINRGLDALFGPKQVTTSVYRQPAAPAFNVASLIGPAALVGGGLLVFKLLK